MPCAPGTVRRVGTSGCRGCNEKSGGNAETDELLARGPEVAAELRVARLRVGAAVRAEAVEVGAARRADRRGAREQEQRRGARLDRDAERAAGHQVTQADQR